MNIKNLVLSAALVSAAGIAQAATVDVMTSGSGSMIVGNISDVEAIKYSVGNVSGTATITVVDFSEAANNGGSPFSATFQFFSGVTPLGFSFQDGATQNTVIGTFNLPGEEVTGTVEGTGGSANFKVSIDIAPVPLPAAGMLLVGALGGLGAMRRRKKS